jgi:lysine-N-methylase
MQLTQETLAKYREQAPELVEAVTSGEAELIMRRDPVTDQCVKLDTGWCSIHRDYGDAFLGDACHFYPRITRALGTTVLTTAALSCPKTAHDMLYMSDGLANAPREEIRVPYSLKNYLPAQMTEAAALSVHEAFLAMAADEAANAERCMLRISAVARALELQPATAWPEAVGFYVSIADGRIAAAEHSPQDMFNLVHALQGLVMASPAPRKRLTDIVQTMAEALGMRFEQGGTVQLQPDAMERALAVMARAKEPMQGLQPVLKRYIQAQLSQALFPFSGFGQTLTERVSVIGVRLATVKLALATTADMISPDRVVHVIQVLSRFMDHLADPTLTLRIYQETGWIREARLRALIGS